MAVLGPTPLPIAPPPVLDIPLDALLRAAASDQPVPSTSNLEQPSIQPALDGADDLLALLRDLSPSQVDDLKQRLPAKGQQLPARRKELKRLVAKVAQQRPVKRQTTTSSSNNGYYPSCTDQPKKVTSCWPQSYTYIVQNYWSRFIWNPNYPPYANAGSLDIYLYSGNSEELMQTWKSVNNRQSQIPIQCVPAGYLCYCFADSVLCLDHQNRGFLWKPAGSRGRSKFTLNLPLLV